MYNSTNTSGFKFFILHFTSCYGAIFLVLLIYSELNQININIGDSGVWGILLISLVYALIRLFLTDNYEQEYYKLKNKFKELGNKQQNEN